LLLFVQEVTRAVFPRVDLCRQQPKFEELSRPKHPGLSVSLMSRNKCFAGALFMVRTFVTAEH
jgi:hypothetical protein